MWTRSTNRHVVFNYTWTLYCILLYGPLKFLVVYSWGLVKKNLKQHAIWLFLKKKSLDLLPIKVKTKNQDQSPLVRKVKSQKKDRSPPIIIKIKTKKRISIPPWMRNTIYIYIWKRIAFFYEFLFTIIHLQSYYYNI